MGDNKIDDDEETQDGDTENDKENQRKLSKKRKSVSNESSSRKKRKISHRSKKIKIKIGANAHNFEAEQLQKMEYFADKIDKNMEFIDDKFGIFDADNFELQDFENLIAFIQNEESLNDISEISKLESFIHCADAFKANLNIDKITKICQNCQDFKEFEVGEWKDSHCKMLKNLFDQMSDNQSTTKQKRTKRRAKKAKKETIGCSIAKRV